MLTELFLIRHGETDWNKKSIFQGQTDIDLNQKGIKNAKKIVDLFTDITPDYIYSSDLKRAKNTAAFLAEEKNINLKKDKKLREINFGDWEGLTFAEIKNQFSDDVDKWQQNPILNSPSGGEKLNDFKKRVKTFFEDLLNKHQGKKIVVFTHGGVIKVYLTILFSLKTEKFWQFQIDNCSLTKLKFYEQEIVLSKLNFTNELK